MASSTRSLLLLSSSSSSSNEFQNGRSGHEDDDDDDDEMAATNNPMEEFERARAAFEHLLSEHSDGEFWNEDTFASESDSSEILPTLRPSCFADEYSTTISGIPSVPEKVWNHVVEDDDTDDSLHGKEWYTMYSPIPMTESSKERRLYEMELIQSVVDSDEGIDALVSLWLSERDYESVVQLQEMEQYCSPGLVQEEALLRTMMKVQDGWVEPIARLATLLYYKGDTEQAKHYCLLGLAMKPWHFEIAQTLVLIALREQDLNSALYWTRWYGLPQLNPSTNHRRRKAWVQRALQHAQESYRQSVMAREVYIQMQRQQEKAKRKEGNSHDTTAGTSSTWQ